MPLYPQQPVGRPAFLLIAILSFIILVSFIVIIITFGFITIAQRQNLQRIYSKTSPSGCFDCPGEGLDHPRDGCRLARRDVAPSERRGNCPHRGGDVADALDRRQGELDGALAAWRQKPFDAEPHCGRVASERKLDGRARQSLGLPCEQRGGGECRLVAGAGPAAGGGTPIGRSEHPPGRAPGARQNDAPVI